ncbi:DHA2 family efflux MFS transporter permease subunit [Marinobacter salarius]|jgi:EmrB/QacA subfamily drug resistance transporter|uniref:Drug resistance transporter, EmrB/QacA subfamily n=2 Tax=Marinobacter salarius TaxID=1420917 RepID=A0A1W6K456_9GAMM|nr:multidrug export protein EmrB [Marinobacter salarius]AZR41058.1 putative transport protein HsrA [Marinobacter salarius]MCC4285122.1 DHA2 family efflux MFS transporter permease subunit [Marinobacter salarius]SFL76322.1 drug resistance transporter, EmrB/QacA subfamily [Marinobacter salarius]VVT25685.1 MFS transporter [Marinobacter salarius]|tara:strand:+ start:5814 stop:7130 length:1317 start_codon:yes stop_codon:yes gene_type:complete
MLGTMATVLSATVVNVALHDIMLEFGIRQGQVHWLATGFIAAMTTTMLASSWLLDHFGVRKTLATAMFLFTVISLLGGFATSPEQLIAARIGQGAMAGLMQPMGMYLVFRIFPRNRRGQAMGIYGMGVILAPALGPVLGGFLVDQLDWRYVMFAPVPVTLTGVFMAWRFLPLPVSRPAPYRFDFPGLVLLGAAIGLSLDTLNRLQELAGQEARIAIEGAVAVIALVLFVIRERRARHPLVNIELLRNPAFVYANVGAMALGLALFGSTYLVPLFVQTALEFTATEAGLLMLPAGIVLGMTFPLAGRLADRLSARKLVIFGIVLFAMSAMLFAVSDIELAFGWLALWTVLGRIGIGFMLPALSTGALNPLAPEQLGAGSSTINFTRQLGGAFGVNIVALTIEFGDHSGGIPTIGAFHSAWWLVAVFVAMAAIPVWKMRV